MSIESSSYIKELSITGFKATQRVRQVAGADLSTSVDQHGVVTANHAMHPTLASTYMRLAVVTMYVKINLFLQANLYFS